MVHHGSHMLLFLSEFTGMPIDQVNFFVVEFVAFFSGILFRKYIKPCPQNTLKRHLIVTLWGILLGHFCFGRQMWHLFSQTFISYILLIFCPRKYVHYATLVFSMSYLSGLHIYRLLYDYGNYQLDVTSPFMISTQKVTALAFAYYDGMKKKEKLTEDQKSQAIRDLPHIIEYSSYIFNFQGILVGPLCFYQDYIDFITGNNLLKHQKINKDESSLDTEKNNSIIVQIDNKTAILKKLFSLIVILIFYFKIALNFPVKNNIATYVLQQPIWYRILYLSLSTRGQRAKYYVAWMLGDLVNNASGMGFNGYDEKTGKAKWNLITNVEIINLELSTNIKHVLDYWNINTKMWLKRICFDRLPTLKTIGVFVLSALWHGFYPGYYFTFVTAAFGTYAGRGIRRKIRPFFQYNILTKYIYSVITWMGTSLLLSYIVAPFELLEFWSCVKFYNSWYWCITIIVVLVTIMLPGGSSKEKSRTQISTVNSANQDSEK